MKNQYLLVKIDYISLIKNYFFLALWDSYYLHCIKNIVFFADWSTIPLASTLRNSWLLLNGHKKNNDTKTCFQRFVNKNILFYVRECASWCIECLFTISFLHKHIHSTHYINTFYKYSIEYGGCATRQIVAYYIFNHIIGKKVNLLFIGHHGGH